MAKRPPTPLELREQLAGLIAVQHTVASAARQAGIPERSARRWAEKPEFRARVKEIRHGMLDQAHNTLQMAAQHAVAGLLDLLTSRDEEIKFKACKEILNQLIAVENHVELAARVEALEQAGGGGE